MMCARCEELEAEVAYLKGELGLTHELRDATRLRQRFRLSPNEAWLVLALHAAKRPLSKYHLLENMPTLRGNGLDRYDGTIGVLVSRIRGKMGADAVTTVWGKGVEAGPALAAKVAEALA